MYHAFLSYSHRADATLAPILQRALERLGTPWWRRATVRVFRDDASLSASAALWSGIEAALGRSERFVLLASPDAARSAWVEREAAWWRRHRSADRMTIVVTAGKIAYDGRIDAFDRAGTDCLPPALMDAFAVEPHWIDLRFATTPEHRTLRHSRFRGAALGVAAAIRGVSKDELESTDIRQHRLAMSMLVGGGVVVSLLGIATLLAVLFARGQSVDARVNRLRAESRRLAAESLTQLDGGRGIEAATLKAAIAWRLAPTDEARKALKRIDELTPGVARVLGQHTGRIDYLAFSRDGQRLATIGEEGVVLQWSLADGAPAGTPLVSEHQSVHGFRFSRDGSHLLVHGERDDGSTVLTLTVFRLGDPLRLPLDPAWRTMLADQRWKDGHLCAAISPGGTRVAVGQGGVIVVIDTATGIGIPHRLPKDLSIAAAGFASEDELYFLAASVYGRGARAGRVRFDRGSVSVGPMLADASGLCGFSTFSDDGLHVASQEAFGAWQIDERLLLRPLPLPSPRPSSFELSGHQAPSWDAAGRRFAYGIGGTGHVWEPSSRRMLNTTPRFEGGHGPPLAMSADGHYVAALDGRRPIVWKLDDDSAPRAIEMSQCGRDGLEDACIRTLCERLTVAPDEKRWRELLGDDYASLKAAIVGTRCAGAAMP